MSEKPKYLSREQQEQIDALIKGSLSATVESLLQLRAEFGGMGIFPNISVQDYVHLDGEDMEIRVSISLNPIEDGEYEDQDEEYETDE
jgi:hypothetical protein